MEATFIRNTDFVKKLNFLTFLGTWAMVFGFWQKNFGRVFSTAFCVSTRRISNFVRKVDFPGLFGFQTIFLSISSVTLKTGLSMVYSWCAEKHFHVDELQKKCFSLPGLWAFFSHFSQVDSGRLVLIAFHNSRVTSKG